MFPFHTLIYDEGNIPTPKDCKFVKIVGVFWRKKNTCYLKCLQLFYR